MGQPELEQDDAEVQELAKHESAKVDVVPKHMFTNRTFLQVDLFVIISVVDLEPKGIRIQKIFGSGYVPVFGIWIQTTIQNLLHVPFLYNVFRRMKCTTNNR